MYGVGLMSVYVPELWVPERKVAIPRLSRFWARNRTRSETLVAAVTVAQSSQSAGGANASSVSLSAATAGNTIVSCFAQTSTTTPTLTGYTINATKGVYNSSGDSVWVAYKIAAGGETSVSWTGGGTGHGVCAWELAGAAASITLDGSVVTTDNLNAATGGRAVTTTTTAGSIILIGVGHNASSGTISAWTGTNVATNISTAAARCFGGSFITTTTVSSTFTANWTNSHVAGMVAVALQPAGGGGGGGGGSSFFFGL